MLPTSTYVDYIDILCTDEKGSYDKKVEIWDARFFLRIYRINYDGHVCSIKEHDVYFCSCLFNVSVFQSFKSSVS